MRSNNNWQPNTSESFHHDGSQGHISTLTKMVIKTSLLVDRSETRDGVANGSNCDLIHNEIGDGANITLT